MLCALCQKIKITIGIKLNLPCVSEEVGRRNGDIKKDSRLFHVLCCRGGYKELAEEAEEQGFEESLSTTAVLTDQLFLVGSIKVCCDPY